MKNFLSFEELDLSFERKAKAIRGVNLDDDSQESNGSGKSSIFYGIEKLIFDSTSKGGIESKLVRRGQKRSYLQLDIECPVRQKTLTIIRRIGGGGDKLELLETDKAGNEEKIQFATHNDGNSRIFEWIGISKEDLMNYYIISPVRGKSFMTSSNTAKIEMISRLVNLECLDPTKEVMDSKVNEMIESIKSNEFERSRIEGKIEILCSQIEDEENRDFEAEMEHDKAVVNRDIIDVEDNRARQQRQLRKLEVDKKHFEDDIEIYKRLSGKIEKELKEKEAIKVFAEVDGIMKSIEEIETNASKTDGEIDDTYQFIQDTKSELRRIKSALSGVIQCPKCGHEFTEGGDVDIEKERERQAEADIELSEANELLDVLKKDLNDFKDNKGQLMIKYDSENRKVKEHEKELRLLRKEMNAQLSEVEGRKLQIQRTERSIENCLEEINKCDKDLKRLGNDLENISKGNVDKEKVSALNAQIEALNKEYDNFSDKIDKLYEDKDELVKWKYNLQRFISELSKESLDVITYEQNKILEDMNSDLRVRWEGFKLKADGSMSDKITPIIARNGFEEPFTFYSTGERGRIEYSNMLTNQKLINSTNQYGGLDFLFTDEKTEGIDGTGIVLLIDSLNKLNKTILITTHVVNQNVNSDILTVTKENEKSTIS